MTSPRKIEANRANAQASTGPTTARGRAYAARNALRHGLSLSVFSDPALSEQVEAFAREIAGEMADDQIYQLARRVAEAQIDLQSKGRPIHRKGVDGARVARGWHLNHCLPPSRNI